MLTYQDAQAIYTRNCGTGQYYKRNYCDTLLYTDGVMDFQRTLDAYWIVDIIISKLPEVISYYKKTYESFYIVSIKFDKERNGCLEIYTEGVVDDIYDDHITLIKQEFPLIDLPINEDEDITEYKMYLNVTNYKLLQFVLLLTSEY